MVRYVIGVLFFCLLISGFSQKQVAEVELPSPVIKNISGIVCGDSVLFTYYRNELYKSAAFNAVWIYPDGSQKRINLKELSGKLLIGVVHTKDSIQYYFLEEAKKKIELGMLTYHRYTNQKGAHSDRITLPGKLLGCYIERNLFLIYATKEGSAVTLLEINNLTIVQQQKFNDAFDWEKLKTMRSTFIDSRFPMRNSQLITPLRLIREDSAIFIVADDPATTETASQPAFKTYISKLDLKTKTSDSKIFFEPSRADFRTVVKDNKVFRFVSRKDPELSIYDFESRTLLSKSVFEEKEKREYYIRWGIKNEIKKMELKSWSPFHSFITVDTSPSGYVLTLGGYAEEDPNVPFIGMFGLLPAAISALANAAVHDLNDGPMAYNYYYLEVAKNFSSCKVITKTGLLKQRIDDYELSLTPKMVYKSYIDGPQVSYAFYLTKGSSKLLIMKFE